MPHYTAVIPSVWSIDDAFAYMSDFSNARFWDPSVREARQLHDHGYELTVRFAGRDKILRYRTTEIDGPNRVVFTSQSRTLLSRDTVTFEASPNGCSVTYRAELQLKGLSALANPLLAMIFRPVGDRARDSLLEILGSRRGTA